MINSYNNSKKFRDICKIVTENKFYAWKQNKQ